MANINFIVKNDIELKGNLIFEGATANAFETTLAITDPTADRTITFPDGSGTVALTSNLSAYLTTSTASSTYAALSGATFSGEIQATKLKGATVGGDEGGEIYLGPALTNTTLAGGITIDVFQNKLRIFEQGGNARGAFLDISGLSNAVGTRLGGVVGGQGTTTSGSNLTVTHGLGTTPSSVTASIRANTYNSTPRSIAVGNIGATTFTVFANDTAGGAVAAAFSWIAVS